MNRLKIPLVLLVACTLFVACTATTNNELTLAKGGKAKYTIVLPDNPSPVETTAAKELKQHLDAITGADFAIVKESAADNSKPQLIVGNAARARALVPGLAVDKLDYDGIVINTIDGNVVLAGHPVRGTLYAVHTFLEEACGVRWWTSDEMYLPAAKTLKVTPLNIRYAPYLIYRESFYKGAFIYDESHRRGNNAAKSDAFAVRMKCNGHHTHISPEYGGYHTFQYFVHSFVHILPPEMYFHKHPEWFSLIGGKRVHTDLNSQLCLTNAEMKAEFIKNTMDTLRRHPNVSFISISQNDCYDACQCQCDKCRQIVEEEGAESGLLIRFVNSVAEVIEKEFPDMWVETLAYQYSRTPPQKVRPRKNVIIRLCTSGSCSQPLGEGDQNKSLRNDIEAWGKTADHLFAWNYIANFWSYMLPHPNIHTLASDIRFLIKNHTVGLFEQGDVYCDAGDFVRMRNWVVSHLMWNPDADENKLIDEFLTGYYGEKAAPYLRQYWDLLTSCVQESGFYLSCGMANTAGWLTVPVYGQAKSLFKQAIDATNDNVYLQRLRREEIPLKYVYLLENERFREYEKQNGKLPFTTPEPEQALNEFLTLLKENNVTMINEDWSDNPNHIPGLEQRLRKILLLPEK